MPFKVRLLSLVTYRRELSVDLLAHADAVKICKIIHRDISSGNILIRPVFLLGNDGHIRVEWVGILTDWELSKPIVPPGTGTARQPERTVSTWHGWYL